jgi:hypothetical protein
MHQAALASPIAIASTHRTYSDGFNSNPPNARGISSRNIPASCMPSNTSFGNSWAASILAAADCNNGISPRARVRQSTADAGNPATGPVMITSLIRLFPRADRHHKLYGHPRTAGTDGLD